MKDEIIQELWRIKDEVAREADYDIHVLCRKLREKEATSSDPVVDRSSTRSRTAARTARR